MANSKDGCFLKSMCFSSRADINANITPIPADAKNMAQKVFSALNIASPVLASAFALADWVMDAVSTIDMASFRMLSPNTNMLSMGSTSSAWNIATVATGSTAEIREPKAKDSEKLSLESEDYWDYKALVTYSQELTGMPPRQDPAGIFPLR